MSFSQLIGILKHLFIEDLAIFGHERFHCELDEHLVGVFSRRLLDNLLRRRDIVVFAPHELFECFGIHTELLGDFGTH